MFSINDLKIREPKMDMRACAYRKKDLLSVGLITEDPKVIGIDADMYYKLIKLGKFEYPGVSVFHLHKFPSAKKLINTIYTYSEGNGKVMRQYGAVKGAFFKRILRIAPFLGFVSIIYRYPLKTQYLRFIPFLLFFAPVIHVLNVVGFWKGFLFFNKESERNLEVLKQTQKK